MKNLNLRSLGSPALLAPGLTGLILGGLLLGIEPVGGDPDRLYRPIKQVLAQSLTLRELPLWSDRFGLGLPLLAESHAAALYPGNWLLYSLLSMPSAYRLSMWLHHVFLAASTFAYARYLRLSSAAAGLAALAFTLCGFQAIHSSHEPFYHALPYLPLCALLAEWYLASGRRMALALLACAWGAQLTLGHFQLQAWTAGLVLWLGLWRVVSEGHPSHRLIPLSLALAWGAAIASVQLCASAELARFEGFTDRPFAELAFYGFPLPHWSELAIPALMRGIPGGPEAAYWYSTGTTGYEACFYVGTLPLLLVFVALAGKIDRGLAPWLVISALAMILAVLPTSWPGAYALVTQLPGLGWFRAPGRYLVIASLGLSLMAGLGLDRAAANSSVRSGLALGWAFALSAAAWSVLWALRIDHRTALGGTRLVLALVLAGLSWLVASFLLRGWQRGRVGSWVMLMATAAELGVLYYTSTTTWGWAVSLPEQSPVLARLAEEPGPGRVAGVVHDLPIRAGAGPIFPSTGFAPLPPHRYLEFGIRRDDASNPLALGRMRRYGVSHGIWTGRARTGEATVLWEGEDRALDRVAYRPPGSPEHARWRLVRYPAPFPPARAAIRERLVPNLDQLMLGIGLDADPQSVWFDAQHLPTPSASPVAKRASVTSWDGRTAVVDHDGSCVLVINRTYYPGWIASIENAPAVPVARVEAGIQGVRLEGEGPSRVAFTYRPAYLPAAVLISMTALAAAGAVLAIEAFGLARSRTKD